MWSHSNSKGPGVQWALRRTRVSLLQHCSLGQPALTRIYAWHPSVQVAGLQVQHQQQQIQTALKEADSLAMEASSLAGSLHQDYNAYILH